MAGEVRVILDKAARPRWAVEIRYATASSSADARVRGRLRGRRARAGSAFAVHPGHNHLVRTRLPCPGQALADRRMRRGQLLSVPELAAPPACVTRPCW